MMGDMDMFVVVVVCLGDSFIEMPPELSKVAVGLTMAKPAISDVIDP